MHILIYISMIIWVLSGIRQFPTKYRYFFIALAISDPGNLILIYMNISSGNYWFLFTSLAMFYSVMIFDDSGKDRILYYILPVLLVITFFISGITELTFVILHLFIFFKVFKIATVHLFENKMFSIFKYMFVFYELTVILNIFLKVLGNANFYFLFLVTLAFQILIGIFFIIAREDKMNLELKLDLLPEQG